MAELLPLVEKYGVWLVVVLYVAYKLVPAVIDKFWPEWMAAKREEKARNAAAEATERAELVRVYERMMEQLSANARFTSAAAVSINGMERALDANTQQIARLAEIVRRGPTCPLPGCPFMDRFEETGGK